MQPKIEDLVQQKDEIQSSLENLSKLKEKDEKEKVQKEILDKLTKLKKEIDAYETTNDSEKNKLNTLKSDVDRISVEMKKFENELKNLEKGVRSVQQPVTTEAEKKDKGWRDSTKEFVGEQREAVKSGDKWKEEPGKNLLRVGGSIITGIAIYKGVKSLWNWAFGSKKEKKEGSEGDSGNNKSFWKSGWGTFLKWTGIGAGAYYVIHGFKTGKWGLGYLLDWDENSPTSTKEELYDDYTELAEKEPEKYEEYEKIGNNINTMYDSIWERERRYFGDDSQIVLGEIGDRVKEEKLQKSEKYKNVDTRGLVPYSLDKFYSNVGELLSYGGVSKYIRAKNIEEYKQKITVLGADWFDKAMVPYLSSFANFATFGILSTDTAQQKMDKFFNGIRDNAGDNLEILDLFFRQYTKVLTYMADKKNALAAKKAREIISVQGYNEEPWPTDPEEQEEMIDEAINDSEWVDKHLRSTSYGAFMSSSILGASKILESETVSQNEMTDELKEIVEDVDSQTEKLIGGFDNNAFTKAEAKLNSGVSLDISEKEGLKKVADNVIDDLGDTQEGGWLYNTFDYGFELLGLSEADRQIILKESGIVDALDKTVSSIKELQADVFANPTKKNVEQLKKLVGEYTSMKKEIAVALYAIQEAKKNKDAGDYISQVLGAVRTGFTHFVGSMNDLFHWRADIGDIVNIFIGLTISGGMIEFGGRIKGKKWVIKTGHYMKKVGLAPLTLTEMGLGRTRWGWAVKRRIKDLQKIDRVGAENLLKKKVIEGVLSPRKVKSIIVDDPEIMRKLCVTSADTKEKIFKKFVTDLLDGSQEKADLYVKYYKKTKGLVSRKRGAIRDGGITEHAINVEIDNRAFDELKKFDTEIEKLGNNSPQRKFFDAMIKKSTGVDDLTYLNKLITNEEFKNTITGDTLKKLRKLSIGELRILESNGILTKFINKEITIDAMLRELKGFKELVEEVADTPARRAFNSCIDRTLGMFDEFADKTPYEHTIDKLKALKKDASLADEEMEVFVKFIDNGFHPKYIPELKKLFDIKTKVGTGDAAEELGTRLKNLLSDGNFTEFNGYLKNPDYQKVFRNANIENVGELSKNLKKTLSKFGSLASQPTRNAIKNVMKVVFKVL